MNMKKLLAGVVAGALAVSSLATVGVFADDEVKTYDFSAKKNTLTLTYDKTVNFVAGTQIKDVFATAGNFIVDFTGIVDGGTNNATLKAELNGYLKSLNASNVTMEAVISKADGSGAKTVKATAGTETWDGAQNKNVPTDPCFNVLLTKTSAEIAGNQLDFSDSATFTNIKSLTLKATLTCDTHDIIVGSGLGVNVWALFNQATAYQQATNNALYGTLATFGSDINFFKPGASYASTVYWAPYTAKSEADGAQRPAVAPNTIYTFEGTNNGVMFPFIENGYANNQTVYAYSLGKNILRWVNDNIVQNKGAQLKIYFMKPAEAGDALSRGEVDLYQTTPSKGNVLVPPSTDGTNGTTNDIMMGVNLPNSSKLQQAADIKDLVATFDWDTLVQNSVSTVSANVSSIAIRVNGNSENVQKLLKDGVLVIEKMEIVVPDQATVPGGDQTIYNLIGGSDEENVTVSGTWNAIYGNGATTLQVTSSFTDKTMAYTLKLTDANGNYVQPAGTVTLKMSIPSAAKGKTLSSDKVKHTCNDGTVEELEIKNMDTYKTDGYIVCETSKFSSFEFSFEDVETEETTTEAPAVSEETTTEAPAADTQPADDGNQPTGVALAVIPAIVAAAGIVISKKRG